MPRLTSLTSRSLLNIGMRGGSFTFGAPGTYYWTAPAGVTKVDVTGQGGSSGTGVTWDDITGQFFVSFIYPQTSTPPGSNYGTSLTYEDVETQRAAIATSANGITTNSAGEVVTSGFIHRRSYGRQNGGDWFLNTVNTWTNNSYTLRRSGTFNTSYSTYLSRTGEISNNIVNTVQRVITGATIERRNPSGTIYGTDTTAFGQTFAASGSQSTVTEVAVTAGTQYTIVVGTDEGSDTAFLSFDYY